MLKVDDTVMLGTHDELLGSEIVLACNHGTQPETNSVEQENLARGHAPALRPILPQDGGEASGASSTSTRRILFTPARRTAETHINTSASLDDADEDMPLAWQAHA